MKASECCRPKKRKISIHWSKKQINTMGEKKKLGMNRNQKQLRKEKEVWLGVSEIFVTTRIFCADHWLSMTGLERGRKESKQGGCKKVTGGRRGGSRQKWKMRGGRLGGGAPEDTAKGTSQLQRKLRNDCAEGPHSHNEMGKGLAKSSTTS